MPAINNVYIMDAEATPVSHNFVPNNGQAKDEPSVSYNKASGIYAGFEKLTTLVRRSTTNKATKVSIQLVLPTLAQTSPSTGSGIQPQPTVAYNRLCKLEFTFPDACTLQERKNIRAMITSALQQSAIVSAIEDLSPLY